jgi:predicted aspartyl protease
MSVTYLDVTVAHVDRPDAGEALTFLIDSRAYFSVVPAAVLDRLGVRPRGSISLRLANGETMTRRRGTAVFRYGERTGGADVIFGEGGDANLLGATTLEAMGLALNPLQRELIELPMLLPATWPASHSSTEESSRP